MRINKRLVAIILLLVFSVVPKLTRATGASLYLAPLRGSFLVGSTFSVSIFLDTKGNEINAVQVDLKFPPDQLQVVSPLSGKSFISVWAQSPTYSNTAGTISLTGGVPSPGINTSAGLVSTVTFRVKALGKAIVSISESSLVLLDDGKGTNILKSFDRGEYNLVLVPP